MTDKHKKYRGGPEKDWKKEIKKSFKRLKSKKSVKNADIDEIIDDIENKLRSAIHTKQ